MINITLTERRLEVSGHAQRPEGTPPGANIICAAVSALTLTLVEGLTQVAHDDISVQQRDGYMAIAWDWGTLSDRGRALIDTWYIGILNIQETYGEITIL